MQQKVWVINDHDWKDSSRKGRLAGSSPDRPPRETPPRSAVPQKSPALSFSLSMLVWGGGHMYMGENRSGAVYMAAMALLLLPIAGLVLFRDSVSRMVVQSGIRPSLFVYSVLAFFLVGLVVWLFNAVLAYYRAANSWSEPFLGVEKQIWPLSCSVLFPGWGQFVNGQPIKGLFFLLFGMIGTFSVFVFSVAQYSWPVIEADPARHVFENYLATALLLVPVVLLMWIVAAYDSFRSCQKLFRKRLSLKTPGYRVGGPSVVRGLVPRSTAILALLLAISLGMQFFPKQYYRDSLEKIRSEMLNHHVEILPEIVQKVIGFLDRQ